MKACVIFSICLASCSLSELDRFYLAPDANNVDAGPCGARGQQCCAAGCEAALSCVGGHCVGCGRAGEPCCGTACDQGSACVDATCQLCGGPGEVCCATGAACEAMLQCVQGQCHGCANSVASGALYSCSVKNDGTVWCWGANQTGELGNTISGSPIPVMVDAAGRLFSQVSAGLGIEIKFVPSPAHTCARASDNTAWCWGSDFVGQLGDGMSSTASSTPVRALLMNGSDVMEVAAGNSHSCARRSAGAVFCWGDNTVGQLGNGTMNSSTTPVQTQLPVGAARITTGGGQTCELGVDGAAYCWGYNNFGQLGNGSTSTSPVPVRVSTLGAAVSEISAGYDFTCAVKTDRTLWCWGSNEHKKAGDANATMIAAPARLPLPDVVHVSAGWDLACAVVMSGEVFCWGALGAGTTMDESVPMLIPLPAAASSVSAGGAHACARTVDGSLWCWGEGMNGQLGDGTQARSNSPVRVSLGCP
jgi:alpha-tubulin suppressor-like RCC1 family protein